MFNLKAQINRIKQLAIEKTTGLPYKPTTKPKPINAKLLPALDNLYNIQAEFEGIAISKRPRYRNPDFDIRLRKRSGESHKRRGHFSSGGYKFTGLKEK